MDKDALPQSGSGPQSCRLLLASIHDVGPCFEREVDTLASLFERTLGGPRFAMLVVPDHWGQAPLRDAPAFQRRLRDWADAGIEIFVHGWFHRDRHRHSGIAGWKARHMTAGEGEFLGLDQAEAAVRMAEGKDLIEQIIGRPAAGFVAPAWLYGPGAQSALRTSGFALAEDHFRVWHPASGEILARGPVVTWASRSTPRQWSSRVVAALARRVLHGQRIVRVAAHPGDTAVPALMGSIERTLASFTARRRAGSYGELGAADTRMTSRPGMEPRNDPRGMSLQ